MLRKLALASALAFLLSACASTSTGPNAAQVQTTANKLASDVQIISQGLTAVLPTLETMPGVTPAVAAKIKADLAIIQTDAAAVQTATSATAPTTAAKVQEIASVVGTIATSVMPLIPGAAPFVPVVAAAQALLPTVLAAAGVSGSVVAPVVGMPPDTARLVLTAAAANSGAAH